MSNYPRRLQCQYDGDFYLMDLAADRFVHFTAPERAKQIIESGRLLMRPPYRKFGIDAVAAVSTVWGSFVPGVQTTHSERDDLVAILFQTDTVPEYGWPEEVIWKADVVLRNPRVVSYQKGVRLLRSAPDFDGQVYYEVPSWCSGFAKQARAALVPKQDLTRAWKAGKRAVEQALRRRDLDGAREAYDALARVLHPLASALDGVRVQRTDEQRKLTFLQDQLRWLGRTTEPGHLEHLTSPDPVNLHAVNVSMESLEEVVPSVLRLYDRIVGYRSLDQTFVHGPFTVHNNYGYRPDEYAEALAVLDAAAEAIRAAGFGDLLYGEVSLSVPGPKAGYCGIYYSKTDTIGLNAECRHRFSNIYTLVHEIGHRHWHQRLSPAQRDAYEDAYAGTTTEGTITLAEREDMWQAFQRAGYTLRGVGRLLHDPSLIDKMRRYVKEMRGTNLVPNPTSGWTADRVERVFVKPGRRLYLLEDAPPSSVTDYGSSDVVEDYAEVFAHHVLGKRLTPDAEERLSQATGKGRPSAGRIASRWLRGYGTVRSRTMQPCAV